MAERVPSRRSFLAKLFAGSVVAGLGSALAGAVAYLLPSEQVGSALGPRKRRVARAEEIPVHDGVLTLVEDEPVWVIHGPAGFVALSALCTHKGCVVRWNTNRRLLLCPCHNGEFDERGNVVRGMPLSALPHYRVAVLDGDVYVSRERHNAA